MFDRRASRGLSEVERGLATQLTGTIDAGTDYTRDTAYFEFSHARRQVFTLADQVIAEANGGQVDTLVKLKEAVEDMACLYSDAVETGVNVPERTDLASSLLYLAARELRDFVGKYVDSDQLIIVEDIDQYRDLLEQLISREDDGMQRSESLARVAATVYGDVLSSLLSRLPGE